MAPAKHRRGMAGTSAAALLVVTVLGGTLLVGAPGRAAAARPVPARPSPGCRASPTAAPSPTAAASPTTSPGPSGQDLPFVADGETGAFALEEPAGPAGIPRPVVFDLHAYEEPGALQVSLSGLGAYGRTRGFTTVTPWIVGRPVPLWHSVPGSRDLAWVGDLLTHVEDGWCIDENRVFVTGYSNGAFMTSLVACRYSSRVAAVAPVAGIQADTPCKTRRPVPVVAFHGTADPLVHFDGSRSEAAADLPAPDGHGRMTAPEAKVFGTRGIFARGPSVPSQAAAWAKRNGCADRTTTVRIAPDIALVSWACPPRSAVELYRIRGGGHTWPGSSDSALLGPLLGRTTFSISADAAMWRFFQSHPLTPPS